MFLCDTVFLERLSSDDDLLPVLGTILLCHRSSQCLLMAAHLYTTDANFVTYPRHRVATKKIQASVVNLEKGSGPLVKNHIPYVCVATLLAQFPQAWL